MGFLDKAKKLAGHAQSKLDDVQHNTDEQSGSATAGARRPRRWRR